MILAKPSKGDLNRADPRGFLFKDNDDIPDQPIGDGSVLATFAPLKPLRRDAECLGAVAQAFSGNPWSFPRSLQNATQR
jgi:hypothetical protein